jgi:multidrug resistance efflux pump
MTGIWVERELEGAKTRIHALESQLAAETARADEAEAMLDQAYLDNIRTAGVYAYSDWLADLARRTRGEA